MPSVKDIYQNIINNNLYIDLTDYNKFTKDMLDAKIKEKKLVIESSLNEKIKTLATKEEMKTLVTIAELKVEKDKIVKLQAFDSSYFRGKNHFEDGGAQYYLCFNQSLDTVKVLVIPMIFQCGNLTDCLMKSNGLSDESIKPPDTSTNGLSPALTYMNLY